MARIVDVTQFIDHFPFRAPGTEIHMTFKVEDPILEWNQGVFTLQVSEVGEGKFLPSEGEPDVSITIQTLTTMLLGYKRPSYLAAIGRLTCNEQTVEILENLIERETPYFSDYF